MRRSQPWMTPAIALFLAFGLLIAPGAAAAGKADEAADYIRNLADTAVSKLGDQSLSEDERAEQFSQLLDETFAMEAISRFVLGRYWRAASEEERQRFIDAFQRMVLQRFLPLFQDYSQDDYEVRRGRQDPGNPDLFLVSSRIADPGTGEMVEVNWRLRPTENSFEIIDVVAEGVSMAITLRSEYGAVIQRTGNLMALIEQLEENLEKGVYKPDDAEGLVQ